MLRAFWSAADPPETVLPSKATAGGEFLSWRVRRVQPAPKDWRPWATLEEMDSYCLSIKGDIL